MEKLNQRAAETNKLFQSIGTKLDVISLIQLVFQRISQLRYFWNDINAFCIILFAENEFLACKYLAALVDILYHLSVVLKLVLSKYEYCFYLFRLHHLDMFNCCSLVITFWVAAEMLDFCMKVRNLIGLGKPKNRLLLLMILSIFVNISSDPCINIYWCKQWHLFRINYRYMCCRQEVSTCQFCQATIHQLGLPASRSSVP